MRERSMSTFVYDDDDDMMGAKISSYASEFHTNGA